MKDILAQFEARIQQFIEENAARLFSGGDAQSGLAQRLVEAMSANLKIENGGTKVAPNLYTLTAGPVLAQNLNANQPLLDKLALMLQEAGHESGLHFPAPPSIAIASDEAMQEGELQIAVNFSAGELPETQAMTPEPIDEDTEQYPQDAFLIVEGAKVFKLNQPVVNLGRKLDNDLVIDDPRVSRNHAQVRAVKGRFMVFDLESSGGVFVNGNRVEHSALYPGDVISLAGVPMVYGQDSSRPLDETDQYESPGYTGDQPTTQIGDPDRPD